MLVHVQWAVFPVADFEMVTSHKEKSFFFFASIGSNPTPRGNYNCWEQFIFINLGNWLTFICPGKDIIIHLWYVVKYDSECASYDLFTGCTELDICMCYESKVRQQGRDGDFFRKIGKEEKSDEGSLSPEGNATKAHLSCLHYRKHWSQREVRRDR